MAKEKGKYDGLLCFLLALIVVLILVIGGGAYYFLVVDNGEKIAEIETEKQEESSNSNVVDVVDNTTTNPYKKYENFKWEIRYTDRDKISEVEWLNAKMIIENGKLYIIDNNSRKQVTTITDTPKYIFPLGVQTFGAVRVITEEGTIWIMELENDKFIDNFKKVNIDGEVVDITDGEFWADYYNPTFYLLKTGKLINEEGKTYEEIHGNHLYMLDIWGDYFINSDYTISGFGEFSNNEKLKDINGNIIKINQVFYDYEGEDTEYIVITDKNQLLCFNINEYVAKPVEGAENSKVSNIEMQDTDKDWIKKLVVTLENGNNIDFEIFEYFDKKQK